MGERDIVNGIFAWRRRQKFFIAKMEHLKSMPYSEYLKDTEWRFIRTIMLQKLGAVCEICGGKQGKKDIHHKTYSRRGIEDANDLVIVCENCHRKIHHIEKAEF